MPPRSAGSTRGCTVAYETFSYISPGTASTYTSNFSSGTGVASAYSGVYYADPGQCRRPVWRGRRGTGNYDVVFGSSNTLTIANNQTGGGVHYFGMWISALDAGNQLQFYNGNTLVYTFTLAEPDRRVGQLRLRPCRQRLLRQPRQLVRRFG